MFRVYSAVVLVLWLAACSLKPPKTTEHSKVESQRKATAFRMQPSSALRSAMSLELLLKKHYEGWRGVPYRRGGLSRAGIDCSGLVYLTFKDLLGVALPRSTQGQATIGDPIDIRELSTGDLVFFKTGWSQAHVGIYLSDGFFMHASTSKGVMISSLDNPYWKRVYWMSRRLKLTGVRP